MMTQQRPVSTSALPAIDTADDARITALAGALYVANAAHTEALTTHNPAATLDNICDAWPEVAPKTLRILNTSPEMIDVFRDAVADRLWAFAVIEHSRNEAGEGYGYVFDFLIEQMRVGADPHSVRTVALGVPERLRAQRSA
ncbi:hypothetical protein AB0E04_03915 [Streptomyces sp. NPDC048251]|uniref:hypothetical protein n=1 Tax=Streptomyces sp. NPDC048251 TaxID=3154501 RepID=UPI00342852F1